MAGRGVDIKLGEGVRELGGLYVLGTERHEARRIDNQLRGRSGRQGDPGETRFYLSGQDDLVRLFAGDRIYNIMERFKLPDDQPMEAKILSNQIENAQKKVEEQNFVSRKNVLKYDDVMNVQRQVIYEQRRRVLEGEDLSEEMRRLDRRGRRARRRRVHRRPSTARTGTSTRSSQRDGRALRHRDHASTSCARRSATRPRRARRGVPGGRARRVHGEGGGARRPPTRAAADARARALRDPPGRRPRWREHLENMDYLREGIHLRAMAQKDPLVEYRAEGHVDVRGAQRRDPRGGRAHALPRAARARGRRELAAAQRGGAANGDALVRARVARGRRRDRRGGRGARRAGAGRERRRRRRRRGGRDRRSSASSSEHEKIGRNDPCWCGSGKKFKKCHGA